MKNSILDVLQLKDQQVKAIYAFGSRVYGNFTESSDHDFIVITDDCPGEQYECGLLNISCLSTNEFRRLVEVHEISALECLFLDQPFKLKETIRFDFVLRREVLRRAISAKSANSWVKAKKKMTVPKDYNLKAAKNSLFHSLRIIDFGIQLCEYKRILNYGSSNHYYEQLQSIDTWEEMHYTFKGVHNQLMTKFRILAPKQELM